MQICLSGWLPASTFLNGPAEKKDTKLYRDLEVFSKTKWTPISILPRTMSASLGTPQQALLVCCGVHR